MRNNTENKNMYLSKYFYIFQHAAVTINVHFDIVKAGSCKYFCNNT